MTISDLVNSSCRWFEGRSPRRSGVPMTTRHLRITPRDATVAIVADPTLELPYRAAWSGVAPTIEEQDGAIEVRYGLGARLRGLLPRRRTLTVALAPTAVWKIAVDGGGPPCEPTCASCVSPRSRSTATRTTLRSSCPSRARSCC